MGPLNTPRKNPFTFAITPSSLQSKTARPSLQQLTTPFPPRSQAKMAQSESVIISTVLRLYAPLADLPVVVQIFASLLVSTTSWVAYNFFLRHRGIPGPLYARLGIPYYLAWRALKLDWVSQCCMPCAALVFVS